MSKGPTNKILINGLVSIFNGYLAGNVLQMLMINMNEQPEIQHALEHQNSYTLSILKNINDRLDKNLKTISENFNMYIISKHSKIF